MINFFKKLAFLWKKPKVIIITGNGWQTAKEAIFQVLKPHFKIGKDVLIFSTDFKNTLELKKFKFLIKNSSLPILVVTQVGEIPPELDFFTGDREKTVQARKIAKILPARGYLILNFDDETVREIKDETNLQELTFGFQERADFRVTDIRLNTGTNFKINYKGNIVPVWLDRLFGKEQIYSALASASVGVVLGLNLVEISQALKDYKGILGKMRLIEGIRNSWILDDSESATAFSMTEAIEILGKLQDFKKKIAVLGDVLGVGKYTIEEHEAIGERVARVSDLLFTFGPRAKFIAQGALAKGMSEEKIFQFATINKGKLKLREEIKEGDLILVDGSKEMKMGEIVEEIKKM